MKLLDKIIGLFSKPSTNITVSDGATIVKNTSSDIIKFADLCSVNLVTGVIEFHKPITIKSNDNISIMSDKHIMLSTSKSGEIERPGYSYSIWLNSEVDSNGNPLQSEFFIDKWGNSVLMEAKYDEEGNLIIPEGYQLPNTHNDCAH